MGVPAGVILYVFNHICFDCKIEAEVDLMLNDGSSPFGAGLRIT
jgi:hypothetical protein